MDIALGADHAGYDSKLQIRTLLLNLGHTVVDFGNCEISYNKVFISLTFEFFHLLKNKSFVNIVSRIIMKINFIMKMN